MATGAGQITFQASAISVTIMQFTKTLCTKLRGVNMALKWLNRWQSALQLLTKKIMICAYLWTLDKRHHVEVLLLTTSEEYKKKQLVEDRETNLNNWYHSKQATKFLEGVVPNDSFVPGYRRGSFLQMPKQLAERVEYVDGIMSVLRQTLANSLTQCRDWKQNMENDVLFGNDGWKFLLLLKVSDKTSPMCEWWPVSFARDMNLSRQRQTNT